MGAEHHGCSGTSEVGTLSQKNYKGQATAKYLQITHLKKMVRLPDGSVVRTHHFYRHSLILVED